MEDTKGNRMLISTAVSPDQTIPMSARIAHANRKMRGEIEKAGLHHVAENLEKLVAVSVRLRASPAKDQLPPGSSKLGGMPDLPPGVAWPKYKGVPMGLLAQFRLQDLVPYDADGRLPKTGILYFFSEARGEYLFSSNDLKMWKAIYFDGDLTSLRPAPMPENLPEDNRFRECAIAFSTELALASWESREVDRLNWSREQRFQFADLDTLPDDDQPVHRILGHPDVIQCEMRLECQLASHGLNYGSVAEHDPRRIALDSGVDDWQFLLQIDSDVETLGTMWGDAGRVYFWIREEDLKRRDFDKVWMILQCY